MEDLVSQHDLLYQESVKHNKEDDFYLLRMDGWHFSPKVDEMNSDRQKMVDNSTSTKRKMVQKKVIRVQAEENDELQRTNTNRPPSDSWSWRKYGQKPIKGSPYPRGYYKCSSCKGCSAKKRVERCKTDASILIITYTSTHNHPPTQVLEQQEEPAIAENRPQRTAPFPGPPSSPTTTPILLEQSSFSSQQENKHGEGSSPPVGQLSEEEELSPSSATVVSSPSLPLDGNDFFNELEELIPISSSSDLGISTYFEDSRFLSSGN